MTKTTKLFEDYAKELVKKELPCDYFQLATVLMLDNLALKQAEQDKKIDFIIERVSIETFGDDFYKKEL